MEAGMPRAIWKGSLRFGLVTIPVGLYAAESPDELDLDLIDRRSQAPVGYSRINKETGRAVPASAVVKGYAVSKGHYVVVSDEDLKRAAPEATQTLDVVGFVERDAIPPIYYDRPYYIAPTGQGDKAYALLREALASSQRQALARVVVRTRQYVAAIYPWETVLVVQLLRYAHELRDPAELALPRRVAASAKELAMAERLISSMEQKWDADEFHDEYRDQLLALIRRKARSGKEIEVEAEPVAGPPKAEVVDLMALLQESLSGQRGAARGAARPARRKVRRSA
jgi:DNA end-binding protein Ku